MATTHSLRPGSLVFFGADGRNYLTAGQVTNLRGKHVEVQSLEDNRVFNTTAQKCKLMGSTSVDGVEDMIQLQDLHEGSLLYNISKRYDQKLIYTFTGSILVAVNPYEKLDVYGMQDVRRYEGQLIGSLPPHIFAIGAGAFRNMKRDNQNQCVVISGESGAGKTESTKLIMQFLVAINHAEAQNTEKGDVEEKILTTNALLESFGNAKTIRNHNSSRFGKYTVMSYSQRTRINGCSIKQYLLEKTRIVGQQASERNYHIFYEALVGLSPQFKKDLHLTNAMDYFYLNQGDSVKIDIKDDAQDFEEVRCCSVRSHTVCICAWCLVLLDFRIIPL